MDRLEAEEMVYQRLLDICIENVERKVILEYSDLQWNIYVGTDADEFQKTAILGDPWYLIYFDPSCHDAIKVAEELINEVIGLWFDKNYKNFQK